MTITFEARNDTLRIQDTATHHQFTLHTPNSLSLTQPASDPFTTHSSSAPLSEPHIDFAVEATRTFKTDTIRIPELVQGLIRAPDGSRVAQLGQQHPQLLPADTYVLELNTSLKLFLRFAAGFTVYTDEQERRIVFDTPTTITIGARSIATQPTATFTAPSSFAETRRFLTYVGEGLATHSPERSWPTLRSHPPQLSTETDTPIPDRRPGTGITLGVPDDWRYLYAAAPLAYYLDATVERAITPEIRTQAGYQEVLPSESAFAFSQRVQSLLKHHFTLDTITRTVGIYKLELYERERLEQLTDARDWQTWYRASLADRLEAYQTVPRSATRAVEPTWRTTATMTATLEQATTLPYLLDELALIQPPQESTQSASAQRHARDVEAFLRAPENENTRPAGGDDEHARSTGGDETRFRSVAESTSLEHVYVGDGIPVSASKIVEAGYRADIDRESRSSTISIQVVCNDPSMQHEVEDDLYGGREELPFDVSVTYDTSVRELETLLQSDTDFFHYIGHLDGEYFYCRDGRLDPDELSAVGVRGFLLNGCESVEQGIALTEAGASGGIVTVSQVADRGAAAVGMMLARLLDQGFSLRGALTVAREQQLLGGQYVGVGNTSIALVQSKAMTPAVAEIESTPAGAFTVRMRTYPTDIAQMGTAYMPHLGRLYMRFITGGVTPPVRVSRRELRQFLDRDHFLPVRFGGEFVWSPEVLERLS